MKSNANTIRGAENFKQLLGSSHVLLQRRKEETAREFPLIPFNSAKHSKLLEFLSAKECDECLIFSTIIEFSSTKNTCIFIIIIFYYYLCAIKYVYRYIVVIYSINYVDASLFITAHRFYLRVRGV